MSSTPTKPKETDEFDNRLASMRARDRQRLGRRQLWHAHHWPQDYEERCIRIGRRHWCRRCLALYPMGFFVAALTAVGLAPWPPAADPELVWLLSIPATVAFVGEAIGLLPYSSRWQVATTVLASVAFGRALGAELTERWNPLFWQPLAVFGGIWFWAAAMNAAQRRSEPKATL